MPRRRKAANTRLIGFPVFRIAVSGETSSKFNRPNPALRGRALAGADCHPRQSAKARLTHVEEVELVAVGIAEVRRIEAVTAGTGLALVGATQRDGLLVELDDILLAARRERDHHAVADRGFLLVVRLPD